MKTMALKTNTSNLSSKAKTTVAKLKLDVLQTLKWALFSITGNTDMFFFISLKLQKEHSQENYFFWQYYIKLFADFLKRIEIFVLVWKKYISVNLYIKGPMSVWMRWPKQITGFTTPASLPACRGLRRPPDPRPWVLLHPYTFDR